MALVDSASLGSLSRFTFVHLTKERPTNQRQCRGCEQDASDRQEADESVLNSVQ